MTFDFSIPCPEGLFPISVKPGSSVVIVGANGGGKTRLAVLIEDSFQARAHRISAHRALTLNPTVAKISENAALAGLRFGYTGESVQIGNRSGSRWQSKMAVSLLNDFDYLIQALFADQANKSLATHVKVRAGDLSPAEATKFEQLDAIWRRLLPHRQLHFSGDDIQVSAPPSAAMYKSSDMSDGERAIFYLIGQTLAAAENSILIFDEPELHIHRSIMAKLWDELEAVRPDCAFVFITHDLEFAASRVAQKFVISAYNPSPCWAIEAVPENTGFNEEIATLILGSRRPILFTEGDYSSLDLAIYRCCFPNWTVIPRGSCENVIHSVVTMRRNKELTRVTCSGIVDADHYHADDIAYLESLGIAVLAVSEIENVILLPSVSRAIAASEGYEDEALESNLAALKQDIFDTLNSTDTVDTVVAQYCRRRIDRTLKKIDLSGAANVSEITAEYARQTTGFNIAEIAANVTDRIKYAQQNGDLPALLASYDNKGLMALAAKHLKKSKLKDFESWLTRVLRSDKVPELVLEIRKVLPEIVAR
jgi:AAA domain, putative AbiEii toxin, Type IV TA system